MSALTSQLKDPPTIVQPPPEGPPYAVSASSLALENFLLLDASTNTFRHFKDDSNSSIKEAVHRVVSTNPGDTIEIVSLLVKVTSGQQQPEATEGTRIVKPSGPPNISPASTNVTMNSTKVSAMNTSNNTNNAPTVGDDEAQENHRHRQLQIMIIKEDWNAVTRMLKEEKEKEDKEQDQQDKTITSSRRTCHMDEILCSLNNDLPMKLLKERDNERAKALLLTLVAFGGKEFAMRKSFEYEMDGSKSFGTLLHVACRFDASIDVVSQLVEAGGKELVMAKGHSSIKSLHVACRYNASIDVVSKLIEVGGKALVMALKKNGKSNGENSLHYACRYNASLDVVSKLIEVGGKQLVLALKNGENLFFYACAYGASIDVILKLIEIGGKALVTVRKRGGENSLLYVCKNNASIDLVSKLIEVGGNKLVLSKDADGCTPLHNACRYNASIDVLSKLIEIGGKELVFEKNKCGENSLHCACRHDAPIDVVLKLIEIGGKEVIRDKDNDGWNALHCACTSSKNASIDVVSMLIEMGGNELVVAKNDAGSNSLYIACKYNAPISVVSKLIEVAGKELVMAKNKQGEHLLNFSSIKSIDVISKLIEVGGKDLIWAKDKDDQNSLHFACKTDTPIGVVSKLIEAGGKELALAKDNNGFNSLRCACYIEYSLDEELLDLLIQHCGAEILTQTDISGETPLQFFITRNFILPSSYEVLLSNASLLISKAIKLQVEGEYGIGGLFSSSSNQEVQCKIYKNWDSIVLPVLEQVMTLPHGRHLPILQAVIDNKTPPVLIKKTIHGFAETINTVDSHGRYPIDLAVHHKLAWGDGMKEIVEALAFAQQTTTFHVCIKHGIQWENGTKEAFAVRVSIRVGVGVDIAEREDVSTGLYPFMVAAVEESYGYDLDSIFHLIKATPRLVKHFGRNCGVDQCSRKRKRS